MNIGEANDFFRVVEALKSPPTTDEQTRVVLDAADRLTARAKVALNAGPWPAEVAEILGHSLDAIAYANAEFDGPCPWVPTVETAEPKVGIL